MNPPHRAAVGMRAAEAGAVGSAGAGTPNSRGRMPEKATTMKLKTIDAVIDGKTVTVAVLDDKGHPVYAHDDGKEIGFDAALATSTIAARNAEAKTNRERAEAAETKLKTFEGIEDPAAAAAALQTVANLNSGDLKTAAQVQEIKDAAAKAATEQVAAAKKALEEQLAAVTSERDKITQDFHGELIGGGFSRSPYIAEKVAIPAEFMQANFARHFKVEDGKVVAYDSTGAKIISRARPGEFADFDEAIEYLVEASPQKDKILKGMVGGGGGAPPGGGGGSATQITRAQFQAMSPAEQGPMAAKARKGEIKIVD